MSELSWIWNCGTGDGAEYPSGVPIEVMASTYSILGNLNPSDSGVVCWTESNVDALQLSGITNAPTGLLNATESGGVVTIDTGVAIVTGWLYVSDSTTGFDINGSPGAANATDIIALRRDTTAGTVRLVRLSGAAGATATLTQTSGTWEIPLWHVNLDGSGEFSSLEDARKPNSPVQVLDSFQSSVDGNNPTPIVFNLPSLYNTFKIYMRLYEPSTTAQALLLTFDGDTTAGIYSYSRWNTGSFSQSSATFSGISAFVTGTALTVYDMELTVNTRLNFAGLDFFHPSVSLVAHEHIASSSVATDSFYCNGVYNNSVTPSTLEITGASSNFQLINYSIVGYI